MTDGSHDLGTNAIWIGHGWTGHDKWFARYKKNPTFFRDPANFKKLAATFEKHNIKDIYPHLCPCTPTGLIPETDFDQTEKFLDELNQTRGFRVMPWIGGVLGAHCFLESEKWRQTFCDSVRELFKTHPRFAGVHINIEPMASGNPDFIAFLKTLRQALPRGKILSVAAYPPTTLLHPVISVHWSEAYFKKVSAQVDQIAVMMYDTAAPLSKTYQYLMNSWTQELLDWTYDSKLLLGVPVYDDTGVLYHSPRVENLKTALMGIHAGLDSFSDLPSNYQGIAIYCEWEMSQDEWDYLTDNFNFSP